MANLEERINPADFYNDYGLCDPYSWIARDSKKADGGFKSELEVRIDLSNTLDDELHIIQDYCDVSDDEAREIMRQWNVDACYEWRKRYGIQPRDLEKGSVDRHDGEVH